MAELEGMVSVLAVKLDAVERSRATDEDYGLVRLSDSNAVTDSTGLALPASEKNAATAGSLAEKIETLRSLIPKIDRCKFLGVVRGADSALDTIMQTQNVPDAHIYILIQNPISDGVYVQGGATHVVLGFQYGNYKYGFQISLGGRIRHRTADGNGGWGEWKTAQFV